MMVTLFYASLLGLLYLVLAGRVGRYRRNTRISIGTGQDRELEVRMRVQANFVEYVPFVLILLALLESLSVSRYGLHALGILLVVARLLHAWGLSKGTINSIRGAGTGLTLLVCLIAVVWGLVVSIPAL
jgi:uncharacterized membrane protein YecN with MAPEG domain